MNMPARNYVRRTLNVRRGNDDAMEYDNNGAFVKYQRRVKANSRHRIFTEEAGRSESHTHHMEFPHHICYRYNYRLETACHTWLATLSITARISSPSFPVCATIGTPRSPPELTDETRGISPAEEQKGQPSLSDERKRRAYPARQETCLPRSS